MVNNEAGGSGPAMDYAAMEVSRRRLDAAAVHFDRLGLQAPRGGDYGAAGPIVALVLGAHAETAARLAAETSVIGVAIALCSADMQITDSEQALDLLTQQAA